MGASAGPRIEKINNIVFSYSEKNRKRRYYSKEKTRQREKN